MSIGNIDKLAYDKDYKNKLSPLISSGSAEEYAAKFEMTGLSPYWSGGGTKGYVRGLSIRYLLDAVGDNPRSKIKILDAGCGIGELSVYLACLGFSVVGVDVSKEACKSAHELAKKIGSQENCTFLAESLENLSVKDSSIDFIIGHAALHHFIKYDGVPREFLRIMKPSARGYFADGFGENRLFHLFHNKKFMQEHGDIVLTRSKIRNYFSAFDVRVMPSDWFAMFDKLYLRFSPKKMSPLVQQLSRLHFWMDRQVPVNDLTTMLAGSVVTIIQKT